MSGTIHLAAVKSNSPVVRLTISPGSTAACSVSRFVHAVRPRYEPAATQRFTHQGRNPAASIASSIELVCFGFVMTHSFRRWNLSRGCDAIFPGRISTELWRQVARFEVVPAMRSSVAAAPWSFASIMCR